VYCFSFFLYKLVHFFFLFFLFVFFLFFFFAARLKHGAPYTGFLRRAHNRKAIFEGYPAMVMDTDR